MFWKTGRLPGLSHLRGRHAVGDPCRRQRARRQPHPMTPPVAVLAWAMRGTVHGQPRGCCLAGCWRRLAGLRPVSRRHFLKRVAAALTSDHDAALSQHPRDGATDPCLSGKRPIPIPHRPFKSEGQLITTAAPLDVTKSLPSRWLSVTATGVPPRPAPPESGTTATIAHRRHRLGGLPAPTAQVAAEPYVAGKARVRTEDSTALQTTPCRLGTPAPASPARSAAPAPDSDDSETRTRFVCSARQAPGCIAGTTDPTMRGDHSRTNRFGEPCCHTRERALPILVHPSCTLSLAGNGLSRPDRLTKSCFFAGISA